MKKLSKEQIETLESGIKELRIYGQELENALYDYNEAVFHAYDKLTKHVEDYNEKLAEMREFRDEIVDKITEYVNERSENWLDTDTGQQVQSWCSDWEALDLDEFPTPDEPEELSGDCDHAESLESVSHAIQQD